MMRWGGQLPPLSFGRTFFDYRDQMLDTLPLKMLPPFSRMNQGGREELFLPYPNKELLIPLFINGVHLCGVFLVFDRDQGREFAIFPSAIFAGEVNAVVRVNIVGAAHREIRGRSRPHRRTVTASRISPFTSRQPSVIHSSRSQSCQTPANVQKGPERLAKYASAVASASASVTEPIL